MVHYLLPRLQIRGIRNAVYSGRKRFEFAIRFAQTEMSSHQRDFRLLKVPKKDGRLFFRFKEVMGTSVTMSYRVSKNNKHNHRKAACC